MSLISPMVSSKSNEWNTPQKLFDYLHRQFDFTLDPCSTDNNAKTAKHFTAADDGLTKDWSKDRVFMNPPYGGKTKLWMEKAKNERDKGALVVCLIVSSTDRSYWHEAIQSANEIWFLRGRIKFGTSKNTAPFASAIVVFRPNSAGLSVFWKDLREVCK